MSYKDFRVACKNSDINAIKEIYDNTKDYNLILFDDFVIFREACKDNNTSTLDCLYFILYSISASVKLNINIHYDLFVVACKYDDLYLTKWLYSHNRFFFYKFIKLFILGCWYNSTKIIEWLYCIKDKECRKKLFEIVCKYGSVENSKIIYTIDKNYDMVHEIFMWACKNIRIDLAKWLYSIKEDYSLIEYDRYLAVRYIYFKSTEFEWMFNIKKDRKMFENFVYRKNSGKGMYMFSGVLVIFRIKWYYSIPFNENDMHVLGQFLDHPHAIKMIFNYCYDLWIMLSNRYRLPQLQNIDIMFIIPGRKLTYIEVSILLNIKLDISKNYLIVPGGLYNCIALQKYVGKDIKINLFT